MRFTCPHCGKRYASADDPAPGRVYSITCRCGNKIMVKGPEPPPSGAKVPEPTPGPSSVASAPRGSFDPFPAERRRVQIGAPASSVTEATPRPGTPQPSRPARSATQASPPPAAPDTPTSSPRTRAPGPARRGRLDPFADMPDLQAEARGAADPLDPFADMPDLQAEARGAARPLADVPEIRGPLPDPPSGASAAASRTYDPFAASHGLLIEEGEARALAAGGPILEPKVEASASPDDEAAVTFSHELKPVAAPRQKPKKAARRVALQPRAGPSAWVVPAAAVVAFVAIGGGAWLLLGRGRLQLPALPAILRGELESPAPAPRAEPGPPRPQPAPPLPEPPPARTTAAPGPPLPPAPATAAVPEPARPAPPAAEPPKAQPSARRERPRREPATSRRPSRQAAAAAVPAPRREPERREPPPPPRREEPPGKPVADKDILDLLGKKQDAPAGARAAGGATRGELTPAEVAAAIRASARAFDACVGEAARNEPTLQVVGRRVGLYITVNPSGVVTGPRLDDADVDDSVLGACLKSTARKMVFPAFGGEPFQVRIPLVLGKGG